MRGFVFGILALAAMVQAFAAQTLTIPVNSERDLSFDQPVSKLYIKDSSIVDATVVDKAHVILSAKRSGVTTIQAVDAAGQRVAMYRVVVGTGARAAPAAPQVSTVTYQRGVERIVYVCGQSRCHAVSRSGIGPEAAAPNVAAGGVNAAPNSDNQPPSKITVPSNISPP